MLFKDNPWFSELQQQLMGNAALERYFHIFILVYHPQHGYDFWMMLSHSRIWMNVGRMHPLRLTVGPFVLKPKDALHRMNMGDEHHWWCQIISFYKLIWQAKRNPLRRASGMQQRAFYGKLWEACLDDLAVSKKVDDNIYLKSIVSTGGKFMTSWQSWWVLAWGTQSIRG
jgi:hypothetical protein